MTDGNWTRRPARNKVITRYGNAPSTVAGMYGSRNHQDQTYKGADGKTDTLGRYYIDVYGEESGYYITSQQETTVTQYTSPTSGSSSSNTRVASKRGRFWTDGAICISWEVGKRVVYIDGDSIDLSSIIASTFAIRAGCIASSNNFSLMLKNSDGQLFVKEFSKVNGIWTNPKTYTLNLSYTANTGNITDVKQLYSAFLTTSSIVTVETHSDKTLIYKLDYDTTTEQWADPVLIDTLQSLAVDASLTYNRKAKIDRPIAESGSSSETISYSHTYTSPKLVVADSVHLTGERIIACNSNNSQLALLIQSTDTQCTLVQDKPQYGRAEAYAIIPHIIMHPMGIVMGIQYDYHISLSAFDSKKLEEKWERSSNNTYTRKLYTFNQEISIESQFAFDGGSFTATSLYYERYAGLSLIDHGYGVPLPPPLSELIDINRAQAYSEMKDSYVRSWSDAIKFYCADPLNEVYLYEKQNGSVNLDYLIYEERHFAQPSTEDLNQNNIVAGTNELILRHKALETVLDSRSIENETTYPLAYRFMIHYEPTMPYYTQNQPKMSGDIVYSGSEARLINKSIDLNFQGRYAATDSEKSAVAYNFDRTFDKPDIQFPNLINQRYWFYTDYSPFPIMSSGTNYHRFFEGYRPCITGNDTTENSLEIDFRLFEDKNRILCNQATASDDASLPSNKIPPEWPEIRGWFDFILRGRFGPKTDLKGLKMITKSNIKTPTPQTDAPISVLAQ